MTKTIGLLLLCGLPGAGKTTLAQFVISEIKKRCENDIDIKDSKSDTQCETETCHHCQSCPCSISSISPLFIKHICFDSIIPRNIDVNKETEESLWKTYRKQICRCVEKDIGSLVCENDLRGDDLGQDDLGQDDSADLAPVVAEVSAAYRQATWHSLTTKTDASHDQVTHLILIDDNMFYPSMRQEYFQLARKYNIGFAEVFLSCSVEVALSRNKKRDQAVPEETIVTMATKLQPPCSDNVWEKYSLTIPVDKVNLESNVSAVLQLAQTAALHPVDSLCQVDEAAVEADRVICSENMLHQADQILRKVVGQEMAELKDISKKERQHKAAILNRERRLQMEDYRSGCERVPANLEDCVRESSRDLTNPFHVFVMESFKERLKFT